MQSYSANDGKMTLNVTFDVGTDVDIMQVNTQNRVGQAEAQLPDAVKREGVVVNRSSPDILLAIGLASPKGTYDGVFLGNYADINLVDQIKRVKGVGDALLVGVGLASGRTSKTSGVDEGVTDGRGLATGVARGLGVATGKAAGGVATGWTRSHFFQVFQK
jgi:hypothetical protein